MSYTPMTDIYSIAKWELTPTQFREKLVYQAILEAFTDQVQITEDIFSQLYTGRYLMTAVGTQLDNVGANLGVERTLSQSDDSYRTSILAEIFTRRSTGTPDYVMKSIQQIYDSSTANVFEHIGKYTGGAVIVVNSTTSYENAVKIMKAMSPVCIQSCVILRIPTSTGYAWTPVEVVDDKNALVTGNDEWIVTDTNLGVVTTSGVSETVQNKIGTLGDPGLASNYVSIEQTVDTDADELGIFAKNSDGLMVIQKEDYVSGEFGIMAEVSQLRMGHTEIEGEA